MTKIYIKSYLTMKTKISQYFLVICQFLKKIKLLGMQLPFFGHQKNSKSKGFLIAHKEIKTKIEDFYVLDNVIFKISEFI